MTDTPEYRLRLQLLRDDPAYAHGFEAGILWCRLAGRRTGDPVDEQRITVSVHSENDEQVIVMAANAGWSVVNVTHGKAATGWSVFQLEKNATCQT